jgi:hypothetical protein
MPLLAVIETDGCLKDLFPDIKDDKMCSLKDLFDGKDGQELKDMFEGNVRNARSLKAHGLWDKRTKAWSNGNKIKVRVF